MPWTREIGRGVQAFEQIAVLAIFFAVKLEKKTQDQALGTVAVGLPPVEGFVHNNKKQQALEKGTGEGSFS